MLQAGFTSVLKTRTRDELQEEVVGFTRRLGFETVSATVVIDHLLGEAEFITIDNTPRGYRDLFQNRANWRRDPVMQHCKRHSMPIIWDQETYAAQGLGDKWEEQARFGYRHGIAMALHMPEGRISSSASTATSRCRPMLPRSRAWWPTCSSSPSTPRMRPCAS
jgi:hypothetical protein